MKKYYAFALVLCFLFSFLDLSARAKRGKFGRLAYPEFEMGSCPIDSTAEAYYIFDKGHTTFRFNRSFLIDCKRHLRIKIVDKAGLDYSHFTFEFPKSDGEALYEIHNVEGYTYNLVKGEVESSAFDPCHIIVEDIDKYKQGVSFSMPNVKVGSIIELRYTLTTRDMSALMPWLFQYEIPVMKSDYSVEIPEYFSYTQYPYGDVSVHTDQYSSLGKIVLAGDAEFSYLTQSLSFVADSVPAYKAIGTRPIRDLGARVEFALKRSHVSDILLEIVESDYRKGLDKLEPTEWYYVNKELNNSEDLGRRLEEQVDLQPLLNYMKFNNDSLATINKALQIVRNKIKWNTEKSCYALNPLNDVISKGKGNVAEVNLTLVALLRSLGYEAYPVVLSTVDNGIVRLYQPSLARFNYLVVACLYEGEVILMDATAKRCKIGELPMRAKNGQGLMSKTGTFQWVTLD